MLTVRMNRMLPEPAFFTDSIDRVFDALMHAPSGEQASSRAAAFPALNVFEDADALHVEAELPGFRMEDIQINLTGDELSITGSRQAENVENGTFLRRERAHGTFTRLLRLGTAIEAAQVRASLENGVLTVTLPKSAASKPRRIAVTGK